MFLKIFVFLQVSLMSLMATGNTGINAIGSQLGAASALVKKGGSGFNLVQYIIVFLGIIIMGMGVNDTFIAEDRSGENKKAKGVMKIIGGALFIAIMAFAHLFNTNL